MITVEPKTLENWQIQGKFLRSCNCYPLCPCVLSVGKALPSFGTCRSWWAVQIETGYAETAAWHTDLSGLTVAALQEIPGRIRDGQWSYGIYIDETASASATDALTQILRGEAGGPTGWFPWVVSNFLGVKRVPMTFEVAPDLSTWSFTIPQIVQSELSPAPGRDGDKLIRAENAHYWAADTLIVGISKTSHIRDWGRNWILSGQSGEYAEIDWRGPQ